MRAGINDFKSVLHLLDCSAKRITNARRTTLFQLCVLSLLSLRSNSAPITDEDGLISTTTDELSQGEFIVNLPYSFRIFGDGKFSSVYINSVGAVSFAGGISTSKLDSLKNKVIAFAPMLLLPELKANVTIQFKFNEAERQVLQQKLRGTINEARTFNLRNALQIKWNEDSAGDGTGNIYDILFADDVNERTFVLYDYIQVDRIQDEHGYGRAGIFALEDGSILCPLELEGSGTEDVLNVEDFHARIDLPLACESFEYSCNDNRPTKEEVQEKLVATFQRFFFETRSRSEWLFYRLYLCRSGLTKPDGSVSVKESCGYDPDYYEYSWRPTTDADVCTEEDANLTSPINRE